MRWEEEGGDDAEEDSEPEDGGEGVVEEVGGFYRHGIWSDWTL